MFKTIDIINSYVEAIKMDILEYGYAVLNIECIEINLESDLTDIAIKKAIEKQIFKLGGLGEQLQVVANEEYNKLLDRFTAYILVNINLILRKQGYNLKSVNEYEIKYF